MLVEIRPVDTERWHGKKGSDIFSRPIQWPGALDPYSRKYLAEFTEEEKERMSKTNFDISLDPVWDDNGRLVAHPTWDSPLGTLELPRMHSKVLDTSTPVGIIQMAIARKCPLIAPSKDAVGTEAYPEAEFYIFSEEMETASKETSVALRRNATKLSFELTADDKRNLVWILKGIDVTGKKDAFIDVHIEDLIQNQPDLFIDYATRDKTLLYSLALVHEAVYKGVLTQDGGIRHGSELLGLDHADAAKFLEQNKNQALKIRIMERLGR